MSTFRREPAHGVRHSAARSTLWLPTAPLSYPFLRILMHSKMPHVGGCWGPLGTQWAGMGSTAMARRQWLWPERGERR